MSTPAKRGLIGAIKAGQSHLGWDDATYRAVLARLCNGKTSSTKCSQLENFVKRMDRIRERSEDKTMNKWLDTQDVCQTLNICPRTGCSVAKNQTGQVSENLYAAGREWRTL